MHRRAHGARPPFGEVQGSGSPGPRLRTTHALTRVAGARPLRALRRRLSTSWWATRARCGFASPETTGLKHLTRKRLTHRPGASHTAPAGTEKRGEAVAQHVDQDARVEQRACPTAAPLSRCHLDAPPTHTVLMRPRAAPDRRALPPGHHLRRAGACERLFLAGQELTRTLSPLGLVAAGFRPAQQGLLLASQDPPDAPGSLLGVRLRPVVPP